MKKILTFMIVVLLVFSCVTPEVSADSQSTTVHYSVSATVIYRDYDETQTTQKVSVGTTLKEPGHKGKPGSVFLGWKDSETGEFWDFNNTVERHLTLIACYGPQSLEQAEVVLGDALIYTGEPQTQEVLKVILGGQEVPSDAYEVSENTQIEAGTYTLTVKAKEGSGYTGQLTWSWVIAPASEDQIKEDENGDAEIGKGSFSIEIKMENGVSGVSVGTDKSDILEMLIEGDDITADELSDVADGAEMEIILVIKDADTTITEASREQIEACAGERKVGQYVDITLFKRITLNEDTENGSDEYAITETDGMITIYLRIPDELINTDSSVIRTYSVIRNHEGNSEILESTYNEDTHTLVFQTNKFSDYAIAYADSPKPVSPDTSSNTGNKDDPDNPDTPDNPNTPDDPNNPDTPDNPNTPDDPNAPDDPDTPDDPNTPDDPDTPQNPDNPKDPDNKNNPTDKNNTGGQNNSGGSGNSDNAGNTNTSNTNNTYTGNNDTQINHNTQSREETKKASSAKTGDDTNREKYEGLILLSAILLLIVFARKRKLKR